MKIQRLFIYPVKSLQPVEVQTAEITNEGLRFDRQYILTRLPRDKSSNVVEHISIKSLYTLALFRTSLDQSWSKLTITYAKADHNAELTVPLTPSPLSLIGASVYQVWIFGTRAEGIDMGEGPARYFTEHLGFEVRLLYIGGSGQREIPGAIESAGSSRTNSTATNDKIQLQKLRFADSAPLLITTTASENDARGRLRRADQSEDIVFRFRPNIHVDTGDEAKPYAEDFWSTLAVRGKAKNAQEVSIRCLFRTVRCLSVNADLQTGGMCATARQLYGLLARDRRVNDKFPHKPVFGQYACAGPSGAILHVGDDVQPVQTTSNPEDLPKPG